MRVVILLFCFSTCLVGQDSDGFFSLFDGTLSGWTSSTDLPESFLIENGVLVVRGGRAHLYYTGDVGMADFKNFELRLKVRTLANSNSGVYFHTSYQADGWPKIGFEAQVNSTHKDPKKTGSLYGIVNMHAPGDTEEAFVSRVNQRGEVFIHRQAAPSTDDEWFDYLIRVEDKRITIQVNGITTVDWTQPDLWLRDRRIGHGTIALQAHDPDSEIHYKDIKIKLLD